MNDNKTALTKRALLEKLKDVPDDGGIRIDIHFDDLEKALFTINGALDTFISFDLSGDLVVGEAGANLLAKATGEAAQ